MTPAKPSLELLRSLTDEHVLRALMGERHLTRAEIAARTGISKPTIGESVRRLTESRLLRDTGERTTGRGGVGVYYALARDLGVALVVGISPEGVVAEALDVHGAVVAREVEEPGRPARAAGVARAVRAAAGRAVPGGARLAVVSAADPVDRATGRLVQLPDAPFLVGELDPAETLGDLVAGPVTADNDVNWAARAERAAAPAGTLDDFAYLYLGEGLGGAVVADGEVRRGHGGLAGEIAHVLTRGPGGEAVRLIEVFAGLGLRRAGTTAVDVAATSRALTSGGPVADALADAVAGVVTALVALTDPRAVVLGGPWGAHPSLVPPVAARLVPWAREIPVRAAGAAPDAPLAGARRHALDELRALVLSGPVSPAG